MNMENLFKKLAELFTSKIEYHGEFNTLFFIEKERNKIKINFLNKQHYHYILMNLKDEIMEITGSDVLFGYLNMNTSPISLKIQVPSKIKPKEKVELPTIKNKTLKQIEKFMFKEHEKIWEEQKEIIKRFDNPLEENSVYIANWGKVEMMANLYAYFKTIKDYDEE